jgi:tetratricopeptide (TPR) repeat protein
LLDTQYSLMLILAQNRLIAPNSAADARAALNFLEQARSLETPSRSFYELRGRAQGQLGDRDAASADQNTAYDPATAVTAQDHFLQGEMRRMRDVNRVTAVLSGDASSPSENLEEAIAEYQTALQLDPKHYWARYQLGRCLLAAGHTREAIEALSACVAIRPSAPWAYATRGLAYALASQPKLAISDLNQAVALDSNFQPARLNRAAVNFWLLGNVDGAMKEFNSLLAAPIESRLTETTFYRGQALLEQAKFHEAIVDFDTTIKAQAEFAPAYWMRARANFSLGNSEAGWPDVETFLRMSGKHSSSQGVAENRFVFGKALRAMGQQLRGEPRKAVLSRASDELAAAIAASPATSEMYQHLGAVEELLGQRLAAIQSYSKGLSIAPNDVALHLMRGWAHANQHELAEGEADFAHAIHDAPRNSEAHAGLGFVLTDQHDFEEAQREAVTALLIDDNNHLTYHYVACIFARLSAAQLDKRLELENVAIAALDRAIAISKTKSIGQDANEIALIRTEDSFPESLRRRPEFQRLVGGDPEILQ